jgi:hypothetical protein
MRFEFADLPLQVYENGDVEIVGRWKTFSEPEFLRWIDIHEGELGRSRGDYLYLLGWHREIQLGILGAADTSRKSARGEELSR